MAGWNADVRERLAELRHELDDYLAGDHNVKKADRAQLRRWRESHQPFHWFVEFFGLMKDGGFDVVIGTLRMSNTRKRVRRRGGRLRMNTRLADIKPQSAMISTRLCL